MADCVYCKLDAGNVIEVRFARTMRSAHSAHDDEAPREIVTRGYYVCDGCMALLDFRIEHHLRPERHSLFNAASAVYYLFTIWMIVGVASLAGTMSFLKDRSFLLLGIFLAGGCLAAWFFRASVHSRYHGKWRSVRGESDTPANSLGALTDLRDRMNPELTSYLPVRFEDSLRIARLPGSPPLRAVGPAGEPWGMGPQVNFAGRGDNEWYRAIWISWRLWPLTHIQVPAGVEWRPPPEPIISEMEVMGAASIAGATFAVVAVVAGGGVLTSLGSALVSAPLGWLLGSQGRAWWRRRELEKYGGNPLE